VQPPEPVVRDDDAEKKMKILVINSGSSSLKYTLFEMEREDILFSGSIDRIGLEGSVHSFRAGSEAETVRNVRIAGHGEALDEMLGTLSSGGLESLDHVTAVAHRVGHGGKYWDAVRVDADVMAEIRRMTPMIPIHHPAMIREIEECQIRIPNAVHVAVFDTWFHKTIPLETAIYGLPYHYYSERGYRLTGFHGNSFAYVSAKAAEFLGTPLDRLKIVALHLGNGASACAIDRGKSIDTTLGMTSVGGLLMGTRCGDVDPGLVPVIMKEDSLTPDETIDMLYRRSGLLGISGISHDMREVEAAAAQGNERAMLAVNSFCHKVKRALGAMLMVLGGCDVLIFTGGIGCNSSCVRFQALDGAEGLGFALDEEANRTCPRTSLENPVVDISLGSSRTKVLVVHTFEELMMARQCMEALRA
jgi:acetate kinase